ncbi:Glucosamine-6-phosphate_isomerase [Hexamita inflata]|uniref:N-acetylglucosaminylphosphatidylinositol deacetylase n=2 Tax=Hexamita inflata TaxID=28002 RepID=A0AA86N4K3_9EUKA|nr:Glucosamine-6-phosphate isomerase [Hexamita inflata]
MNLKLNGLSLNIYDTENEIIQQSVNIIQQLPDNALIALWPDSIGRQILQNIKIENKTLKVFTLGSFKGFSIGDHLKDIVKNENVKFVTHIHQPINTTFICPRPTTLDAALITVNNLIKPYNTQFLIDEIGATYGYERSGSFCRSDVESSQDSEFEQQSQFQQVLVDTLIQNTQNFCFVFKGDLYKDCCAAVLESRVGLSGLLLNRIKSEQVTVLCDVLSSSNLTMIQQPWTQSDFTWSARSAKMAFAQAAARKNIKISAVTLETLSEYQMLMPESDFSSYRSYVLQDLSERIRPLEKSIIPSTPLKVIIFSPHPDDDVISAGAVLSSLIQQPNVELHVAYCVSGAVAVPDSFVMNYLNKFNIEIKLENGDGTLGEQISYSHDAETHDSITKEQATKRFISGLSPKSKGLLREVEAMSALKSLGFFKKSKNQAHFLRMPFYGSGFGMRSNPQHQDTERVLKLLETVKPDVILLAGDLSDPHGTHGFCYQVIKEALEEFEADTIKSMTPEEICKLYSVYNTRLVKKGLTVEEIYELMTSKKIIYKLMYRGAWAEFNIEDSTFILTFNKQQMEEKMTAIREHYSQMGEALYLGGDNRAFDVRAKQRNSQTAEFLKVLGLANESVEGAECFVGCGLLP